MENQENLKKDSNLRAILKDPNNLILKYIDGDWYLLFGEDFSYENNKKLNFNFYFQSFSLNILASTKKIDGCYLLDRETKSISNGIRQLSLNDIDPLKIHLDRYSALVEDSIFNKRENNVFDFLEPIQEDFYRKGFNDALELSKKEYLKSKNFDIFEFNLEFSDNTFLVEINVCNIDDSIFKQLYEFSSKPQGIDNIAIKKYILDKFITLNSLVQPMLFIKTHTRNINDVLRGIYEKENNKSSLQVDIKDYDLLNYSPLDVKINERKHNECEEYLKNKAKDLGLDLENEIEEPAFECEKKQTSKIKPKK
jgi:hypothetical protein